jgi:energy-converting hydrogenase Eha subunit A
MPSDATSRMLAAREEIIQRIRKSAEMHALNDAQLVAVGVHAIAASLIEVSGITTTQAAGAIQAAANRYAADCVAM